MPFMSYQVSNEEAVRSNTELMSLGSDAVKLEGGKEMALEYKLSQMLGSPLFLI